MLRHSRSVFPAGVPPGPLYGRLKSGAAVVLENGTRISPGEVLEAPVPGRKVCVLGDCSGALGDTAPRLCWQADLLVHEATLGDSQRDTARQRGHSTPGTAAELARSCRARRLVLTHFSQRYRPGQAGDSEANEMRRQAETVLEGQEVTLAEDFMTIEIPLKKGEPGTLSP